MTENVSKAEVEALVGRSQDAESARPVEVQPRDFRRPRRLGEARLGRIRDALLGELRPVEDALTSWLRGRCALGITSVDELGADSALADQTEPFVVLAFEVSGLQGWLVWESGFAIAAVGAVLGAPPTESEPEPRALTPVEAGVVRDLMSRVAGGSCAPLGLELGTARLLQTNDDLLLSLRASALSDSHRTAVHFELTGPCGTSTLRLYLPGVEPEGQGRTDSGSSEPAVLPEHLDVVPIDVGASLGSVEIPLKELLRLEVGDVIPLGVPAGASLRVTIEDRPCASADWGNHEGLQVLRLRDFTAPKEDD